MDLIISEHGQKAGRETGRVWFYPRKADGTLGYREALKINGVDIVGRYNAPCIVDWNNDGRLDMILGNDHSSMVPALYINDGSAENYHFSTEERMKDKYGTTIYTGGSGRMHVKVTDLDNDGDKDMVLHSNSSGSVCFVENSGTDAAPSLEPKVPLYKSTGESFVPTSSNIRFDFWDWNGDGYEDLIWSGYVAKMDSPNYVYQVYTNPMFISFSSTNGVITDTKSPQASAMTPIHRVTLSATSSLLTLNSPVESVVDIALLTPAGKEVRQLSAVSIMSGSNKIPLKALSKGVYLMKITGLEIQQIGTIIIR